MEIYVNSRTREDVNLSEEVQEQREIGQKDRVIKQIFEKEWSAKTEKSPELAEFKERIKKARLFHFSNNKDRILEIYNLLFEIEKDLEHRGNGQANHRSSIALLIHLYGSQINKEFSQKYFYPEKDLSFVKRPMLLLEAELQKKEVEMKTLDELNQKMTIQIKNLQSSQIALTEELRKRDKEIKEYENKGKELQENLKKEVRENQYLVKELENNSNIRMLLSKCQQ